MSDATELAASIKDGRHMEVKVRHMTFICKRPTWEQTGREFLQNNTDAQITRNYVTGWSGVKKSDLLPGAPDKEIEYNKELFDLAVGDMAEVHKDVSTALIEAAHKYRDEAEEAAKNSLAG